MIEQSYIGFKDFLLVEISPEANTWEIFEGFHPKSLIIKKGDKALQFINLPENNWQIIGKADTLTEEQANAIGLLSFDEMLAANNLQPQTTIILMKQ